MKKFLCFFVLLALCSCTDMNIKVQIIESPTDCVTNDNWSWNDGVAKTNYDVARDGVFEFKSKLSGVLSFKYAFWDGGYGTAKLYVKINGKECFHEYDSGTDTIPVVIKNIAENSTIRFVGYKCMVKDLMISSSLEEEKPEDNTSPNDF